jgi:hypothetical protein
MKRLIYPCLALLMACSQPKQTGLIYYNDLESISGWADVNISNEQSHSGVLSNKLDTARQYGINFRQSLKKISNERISKIEVSMWVYITPKAQGNIVLEVHNHDGSSLLWDSKTFDGATVEPNKWQLISKEFILKDPLNNPENIVAIYPWCNGKSTFYVDDVRIEFVP